MAHGNEAFVFNKRFIAGFTVADDTGTPVTFAVEMYGDVNVEPGGYNLIRHMDEKGDFAAYPPNRGNANTTKITIKAKQLGFIGQTAAVAVSDDLTLGDYIFQSGEYANLTSTLIGSGTRHEKTFEVTFTIGDGTNSSTVKLANATVVGKFNTGEEANEWDVTFEGNQPFPTVAYT